MTADARPAVAFIPVIATDGFPVARVRIHLQSGPGAMAGHTDIAVTMARSAGLQVTSRLRGMICGPLMGRDGTPLMTGRTLGSGEYGVVGSHISDLYIAELLTMGLELQIAGLIAGMALPAVLLVMAAVTGLGIILGFNGMKLNPVALVALGNVIAPVVLGGEIGIDATAGMTIKAIGLIMALTAIAGPTLSQQPVTAQPVSVVIQSDAFILVTVVAL